MLTEGPRQFDLYDFFSVFLPGLLLIIGLFPFLPSETSVFSTGAIIPLSVGGFVIGRGIHAFSIQIDSIFEVTTHREFFKQQIRNPTVVSYALADAFYHECREAFPEVNLPKDRRNIGLYSEIPDTLYGLVRGYIHIDARGRSRTFQAVFDFYRSVWLVSLLLMIAYTSYGIALEYDLSVTDFGYGSHLSTLGFPPLTFVIWGGILLGGSYLTFRQMRKSYRDLYIQYLISDFVVLTNSSE